MSSIGQRKKDHVEISLQQNVGFKSKTNGFEKWDFVHHPSPEFNFADTDCSTVFLGRQLSFPFLISAMTGGYKDGEQINRQLAEIAEQQHVAFSTGSLRPLIRDPRLFPEYKILRQVCKSVPLIGNIGAVNLFRDITSDDISRIIDELQPDAIALHFNPLQEVIQPNGDTDFSRVLAAVTRLTNEFDIPFIAKETGAGISGHAARELADAGVQIIDVAGAGGTSWSAVEAYRSPDPTDGELFRDWGIPTEECVRECAEIDGIAVIASGGINNGLTIAKAIALGAQLAGSALPVLKALDSNGVDGVNNLINSWRHQLKICQFLTRSPRLALLNRTKLRAC